MGYRYGRAWAQAQDINKCPASAKPAPAPAVPKPAAPSLLELEVRADTIIYIITEPQYTLIMEQESIIVGACHCVVEQEHVVVAWRRDVSLCCRGGTHC
jgi:hypothetical protein